MKKLIKFICKSFGRKIEIDPVEESIMHYCLSRGFQNSSKLISQYELIKERGYAYRYDLYLFESEGMEIYSTIAEILGLTPLQLTLVNGKSGGIKASLISEAIIKKAKLWHKTTA